MTETQKNPLRIGIIGAGLGGLMAGIAIAEAGGNVTILEAASELGEVDYLQGESQLAFLIIHLDWSGYSNDPQCRSPPPSLRHRTGNRR